MDNDTPRALSSVGLALIESADGVEGERKTDTMVRSLIDGSMPGAAWAVLAEHRVETGAAGSLTSIGEEVLERSLWPRRR